MLERAVSEDVVRSAVHDAVREVMEQRGLDTGALANGARLAEGLGLKSMDLAQIVLTLEDDLDCDPFGQVPITSVRTVGDLVGAYLVGTGLAEAPSADMSAEIAAASARRRRR